MEATLEELRRISNCPEGATFSQLGLRKSVDITPKSDVSGVALNLEYTYRVRQEAIAMLVEDPVFGALVAFGQGGASINIQHDSSRKLPPDPVGVLEIERYTADIA